MKIAHRNFGVEALRVGLMFGICLLHVLALAPVKWDPLKNIVGSCVASFVCISGWYGIKFSMRKVFSLTLTAVWCASVSSVFCGQGTLCEFFSMLVGYWFLWAYIVVMCFAPLINCGLKMIRNRKDFMRIVFPIAVLVFGWSYCSGLAHTHFSLQMIPRPAGFGCMTFLSLIGVYVVSRGLRVLEVDKRMSTRNLCGIVVSCGIFVSLHPALSANNSIVSLLLGLSVLLLMQRAKVPLAVGRFVAWVAPGLFSVYCLHATNASMNKLAVLQDLVIGARGMDVITGTVGGIAVSLIVFFVCLIIDIPRRLLFYLSKKFVEHIAIKK